jgi:hypothetical protein
LGSSDFARRYFRNHCYFLFPGYLDGSVPPVSLPLTIYSLTDTRPLKCSIFSLLRLSAAAMISFLSCGFFLKHFSGRVGYPIRQSADQWMFAPPRRFSQLATAFFALIRQGIRHKPLFRLTILLFQQNPFGLCFLLWSLRSKLQNETRSVSLSIPELLFIATIFQITVGAPVQIPIVPVLNNVFQKE